MRRNCSSCNKDLSCICTIKKYKNPINGLCENCTNNCWSCTGPDIDQCITCNSDYVKVNGICQKNCLDGYRKQLYYKTLGVHTLSIYTCT